MYTSHTHTHTHTHTSYQNISYIAQALPLVLTTDQHTMVPSTFQPPKYEKRWFEQTNNRQDS